MSNVYSHLKVFHYPEKLASLPRECAITPPLHLRIKPTNTCNHRCSYCAYRDTHLQLGKDMREADSIPRAKMLEIAHDIVSMGVKAVTFSGGGEPLVYPHLLETVRILHAGGVKFACLTNGARLTGEIADFFAHNATWLRISMDGWDDPSYSHYRGVGEGEFTKILRNIEAFISLKGSCALGVSYIVNKDNWSHIPTMLRLYKQVGVTSVKVSACIVSDDMASTNAYHAPHFAQTHELVTQAQAELADAHFEIFDAWHSLHEHFTKSYTYCPFSQMLAVIGADSKVYPCQDKAYNATAVLGDLSTQSLHDFWMHNKEAFFRLRPCVDCQHHCVANDKNMMLLDFLQSDAQHLPFV